MENKNEKNYWVYRQYLSNDKWITRTKMGFFTFEGACEFVEKCKLYLRAGEKYVITHKTKDEFIMSIEREVEFDDSKGL